MARTARSTGSATGSRSTAVKRTAKKTPGTRPASRARRTTGEPSRNSSAGNQARGVAADAQQQARTATLDQLSQRSNQAGDQLGGMATDIRQIADQLRSQDNHSAAQLADSAAGRIQQVGDYLSGSSAQHIVDDVEAFSRSRPWLVTAVTTGLGFAAARALSASSRRRHGGRWVDTSAGDDFDASDAERDDDSAGGR
jgi:ElaB/YqjD/DUF883 family membrane-anchored ribosome-binding protein